MTIIHLGERINNNNLRMSHHMGGKKEKKVGGGMGRRGGGSLRWPDLSIPRFAKDRMGNDV